MPKPQETALHTTQRTSERLSITETVLKPINFCQETYSELSVVFYFFKISNASFSHFL